MPSRSLDLFDRAKMAIALKDYAVTKGLPVSDEILERLADVERQLEKKSASIHEEALAFKVDKAVRQLTQLTYPTTIDSLYYGDKREAQIFKRSLPLISILSVTVAMYSYSFLAGRFSQSILAAALGLLGSLVYQIFNVIGILHEKAFTSEDVYGNYLRMLLGTVMGWVMYVTFCHGAYEHLAKGVDLDSKNMVLVFVPFLVGFSTKLVVGILEQLIRSVMLVFGIEDKRTDILLRRRRNRDPTPSAGESD